MGVEGKARDNVNYADNRANAATLTRSSSTDTGRDALAGVQHLPASAMPCKIPG